MSLATSIAWAGLFSTKDQGMQLSLLWAGRQMGTHLITGKATGLHQLSLGQHREPGQPASEAHGYCGLKSHGPSGPARPSLHLPGLPMAPREADH